MQKCLTDRGNYKFISDGERVVLRPTRARRLTFFTMAHKVEILTGAPPNPGECYKYISLSGGFSSIAFIRFISKYEHIFELTASTLRIGEKQFNEICTLSRNGKIEKATFFTSTLMKSDAKREKKYDYFSRFEEVCAKNGWKNIVVNNHSKIILMRTENNCYVLETSSNLNENPKIEQFSFENSCDLYEFYFSFFKELEKAHAKK